MRKIYNFSAGPACLPGPTLKAAKSVVKDYKNSGISILEMSHRSAPIVELFDDTTQNLINLLDIPENYSVLWLQGGASLQFSMVPMNLLPSGGTADYIDTGSWSAKAVIECQNLVMLMSLEAVKIQFILTSQKMWLLRRMLRICI